MQTAQQPQFLSVDEYLAGERESEIRHEYLGGMVYAMAGTTESEHLELASLNFKLALRAIYDGIQL